MKQFSLFSFHFYCYGCVWIEGKSCFMHGKKTSRAVKIREKEKKELPLPCHLQEKTPTQSMEHQLYQNRRVAMMFKVMQQPTFLYYKNGEEVGRIGGDDTTIEAITAKVEELM